MMTGFNGLIYHTDSQNDPSDSLHNHLWDYIFMQLFMMSQLQICGWTRVHQVHPQICCEKTQFRQSLTSSGTYSTFCFWLNSNKQTNNPVLSYSQRMNLTGSGVQVASQRLFTGTFALIKSLLMEWDVLLHGGVRGHSENAMEMCPFCSH